MQLKSLKNVSLKEKRILLRVDYNTPLRKSRGKVVVANDSRIRYTLPTLHYLVKQGAKIVIVSHLGRPDGKVVKSLSLTPVAKRLQQLLGKKITLIPTFTHTGIAKALTQMKSGDVAMLENTRFHPGEKAKSRSFAKALAKPFDLIVNEGFAVSHRDHASVSGIARYKPMVAGFHLLLEVKMLSKLMTDPKRPLVAVIGGAKVSDKVDAIHNLAKVADSVLVGGGVANNFLKAEGVDVLSSYMEETDSHGEKRVDFVAFAKKLMYLHPKEKMLLHGYMPVPNIVAPVDVIAAKNIDKPRTKMVLDLIHPEKNGKTNRHLKFLDIGPKTIKLFKAIINQAGTVFWNGPMGVYEVKAFSLGTKDVARAVAHTKGVSILGGGDTIGAINHLGFKNGDFDYVSSAGGAALEFLAGKKLPGLEPMRIR